MMKRSGQMKVKKQGNRVWVELETEKEMRIYMHPLRQRILDLLARNPNGMSAKKVADALQIAPSSAGHHLRALQDICLVEEIRTEKIHGFEAKIYGDTHASVHITPKGMELAPGERTAFLNRELSERSQRFYEGSREKPERTRRSGTKRGKEPAFKRGNLLLQQRGNGRADANGGAVF